MNNITDEFEDEMRVLFNGRPASIQEQYRGIDFWIDGVSVSVKNQKRAIETGNYAFELKLIKSDGTWAPGAFESERSQVTLMTAGDGWCYFFLTSKLKQYCADHPGRLVGCTRGVVEDNRKQGRIFVDAIIQLLPVKDVNSLSLVSFERGILPSQTGPIRSIIHAGVIHDRSRN
jgi:hypothetical protein